MPLGSLTLEIKVLISQLKNDLGEAKTHVHGFAAQASKDVGDFNNAWKSGALGSLSFAQLKKDLDEAKTHVHGFSSDLAMQIQMNRMGFMDAGLAVGALGAAITGVLIIAAKIGGTFEHEMAKVRAVLDPTAKEFGALRDTAIDLGIKTIFSAQQVAEGMGILGQAGFSVKEVLAAIPDVLNLASAGSISIADAADIASGALRGFNIDASETGVVTDIIAKTAVMANTNISEAGTAFSYVSGIAYTLGISMAETAAAIGILSDAGIKGTRSGTGLRSLLSDIINPTKEAQKAINALGLEFRNADGSVKSLTGIIGELEKKQVSASDIMKIFGDRSGLVAITLKNKGSAALVDFTTALENSKGAAKRMADTMRDNMMGTIERLSSSVDALMISLSGTGRSGLQGAIRSISEVITDVIDWTTKWTAAYPGLTRVLVVLSGTLGGLLGTLGLLLIALPRIIATWQALQILVTAGVLTSGPFWIAVAAITGIAIALGLWLSRSREVLEANAKLVVATRDEGTHLENLLGKYRSLRSETNLTKEKKAELAKITDELAAAVGSENTTIDEHGKIIGIDDAAVARLIITKQTLAESQVEAVFLAEKQAGEALSGTYNELGATSADLETAKKRLEAFTAEHGIPTGFEEGRMYNLLKGTVDELTERKIELSNKSGELSTKFQTAKTDADALRGALTSTTTTTDVLGSSTDVLGQKIHLSAEEVAKARKAYENSRTSMQDLLSAQANLQAWVDEHGIPTTNDEISAYVKLLDKVNDLKDANSEYIRILGLVEEAQGKYKTSMEEDLAAGLNTASENLDKFDLSMKDAFDPADPDLTMFVGTTIPSIGEAIRQIGGLEGTSPLSVFRSSLHDKLKEAGEDWGDWVKNINKLTDELVGAIGDAFKDGFVAILHGDLQGLLDTFKDFFNKIYDAFIDMIAKMVAAKAVSGLASGLGLGGAVAETTAGAITGTTAGIAVPATIEATLAGAATIGGAAATGTTAGGAGAAGAGAGAAGIAAPLAGAAIPFLITGLVDWLGGGPTLAERQALDNAYGRDEVGQILGARISGMIRGTRDVLAKLFDSGGLTYEIARTQIDTMLAELNRIAPNAIGYFSKFEDAVAWRRYLLDHVNQSIQTGILQFAEGGIVMRPYQGMMQMAERGPEAVVPLDRLGEVLDRMSGNGSGGTRSIILQANIQALDVEGVSSGLERAVRTKIIPIILSASRDGTRVVNTQGVEGM